MIWFQFEVEKITQATVFIMSHDGVDMQNYTKILKLLYLADRESISKKGTPMTGDEIVLMPLGHVLSKTYNLMKEELVSEYWQNHISLMRGGYELRTIKDPGTDGLSDWEIKMLENLISKYENYKYSTMIDVVHDLPEWNDPRKQGKEMIPLDNEIVMRTVGITTNEIEEIREETLISGKLSSVIDR